MAILHAFFPRTHYAPFLIKWFWGKKPYTLSHKNEKKHKKKHKTTSRKFFSTLSFSLSTLNFADWNLTFTWELQNNNRKNTYNTEFNKPTTFRVRVCVRGCVWDCLCWTKSSFFASCGIWCFGFDCGFYFGIMRWRERKHSFINKIAAFMHGNRHNRRFV